METDLVRPERSAHASIRGYLYQCCLGALRWLRLADGEVLVCEGDEDLDRYLLDGRRFSEQVKHLETAVSIRSRAVRDSLRQFLLTYVALRRGGEERRFVFSSTAARRRQQRRDLETDVLASWTVPEARPQVIRDLRRLLPVAEDEKGHESLAAAMTWLDEKEAWSAFVDAS